MKIALPPRKQPERSPRKKGGDLGGGAGGVNYAHQDQNSSPWQAVLLLKP